MKKITEIYWKLFLVFGMVFYYLLYLLFYYGKYFFNNKYQHGTVLYLAAFFPSNAGFNWRVVKWAEILSLNGHKVEVATAISAEEFYYLRSKNHSKYLLLFLHRRFWQVIKSFNYEIVIVRREILPYNDYGDLFLERLLIRYKPNSILDFDDDISAAKSEPRKIVNKFGRLLKENGNKFNDSLSLYSNFIVASSYLVNLVLNTNTRISSSRINFIPTCVDYNLYKAKVYSPNSELLRFGWIGGEHNYNQLVPVIKVLDKIYKNNFKLLVIGGQKFEEKSTFEIEFIKWSLKDEVENLLSIDVGLMPLIHDKEAMGKGGFKLIQYMGLGIVSIASAITINLEIVDHNVDAILVNNAEDWEIALQRVLSDDFDFCSMGASARYKAEGQLTFAANTFKYLNFISNVRNSRYPE